jgi:hypothetical protein
MTYRNIAFENAAGVFVFLHAEYGTLTHLYDPLSAQYLNQISLGPCLARMNAMLQALRLINHPRQNSVFLIDNRTDPNNPVVVDWLDASEFESSFSTTSVEYRMDLMTGLLEEFTL